MEIPGLGPVSRDDEFGGYRSAAWPVPVLKNSTCVFVVDGYDGDPGKEEFHSAISAFLALDESTLWAASPSIFEYYQYVMADCDPDDGDDRYVEIADPDDVWDHIDIGGEVLVQRHAYDDRRVYVSVECECDWEPEHGLQIVFREGRTVTKVGPYNGHLTNAAAYGRDDLEGVVYHRPG